MTIRAYSELYLNDAMNNLACAFDYAINVCGQPADWFATMFVMSGEAELFERGNPSTISGKSGVEMARDVMNAIMTDEPLPEPVFTEERSPEYWAGWALAQYQWSSAKSFKDIFAHVPLSEIVSMYRTFHEMDISRFCESVERRYNEASGVTNLRRIRESGGFTQSELATASGVSLRSIEKYEQKVNDINKAQVQTVYKLACALNCGMVDLLESPEKLRNK